MRPKQKSVVLVTSDAVVNRRNGRRSNKDKRGPQMPAAS